MILSHQSPLKKSKTKQGKAFDDDVLSLLHDGLTVADHRKPQGEAEAAKQALKRKIARKQQRSTGTVIKPAVDFDCVLEELADQAHLQNSSAHKLQLKNPLDLLPRDSHKSQSDSVASSQHAKRPTKKLTKQRIPKDTLETMRIGDILVRMGKLKPEQIQNVLDYQKRRKISFGRAAIALQFVQDEDIKKAIAYQFGYTKTLPQSHKKRQKKSAKHQQLVMLDRPFSTEAEQFRMLRTRLFTQENAAALKLLSVTSMTSDGAYVTANLAISLAQMNRKVLLIDTHLRHPHLHNLFEFEPDKGLTDLLNGRFSLKEVLVTGAIRNLAILPAGTKAYNPQELLSSATFQKLVMRAMDKYDSVVISAPGGKETADGQYVWSLTKSVILVARRDKVRLSEVKAISNIIRDCGAHIVGTVLAT